MILSVRPTDSLKGTVNLPPSKSYSIRAFIVGACGGISTIFHPSRCEDALVSMRVARNLGAKIIRLKQDVWKISSQGIYPKTKYINVGESGTVLRFLLPLLALSDLRVKVMGEGTLKSRPNRQLARVLREQGVNIRGKGSVESVPIILSGGQMQGGGVAIDGSLSSQFISALLIACPQLTRDSSLHIKGRTLVSKTYIEMTRQVLKKAGVHVIKKSDRLYKIKSNQTFNGLENFYVPSDYGLSAFLLAGAAITDSHLILRGNLKDNLVQSDGMILCFLKRLGVDFIKTSQQIMIRGPFPLKGGEFSLKDSPDLVPIMSVLALFAKGPTRLYGIKHVRLKESDRISDLRAELLKIGARVFEKENELVIHPREDYKRNVLLNPRHDHRLAMSFAILGLKLGIKVKDIECVKKSYPQFIRDLKTIGGRISLS